MLDNAADDRGLRRCQPAAAPSFTLGLWALSSLGGDRDAGRGSFVACRWPNGEGPRGLGWGVTADVRSWLTRYAADGAAGPRGRATCRRSTASWCRSTAISTSFASGVRPPPTTPGIRRRTKRKGPHHYKVILPTPHHPWSGRRADVAPLRLTLAGPSRWGSGMTDARTHRRAWLPATRSEGVLDRTACRCAEEYS
jgi:hypothetical protein